MISPATRLPVRAVTPLLVCAMLAACAGDEGVTADAAQTQQLAAEAYIYGFPVTDNYKTMYAQALDVGGPDFKAPLNQIASAANVFTPSDTSIITPNSDTPYSFAWLDLRAEPMVLTLPTVEPNRYFSVQLVDIYTQNFAYLGRRTTGSEGGSYLIAGPEWKGTAPASITKVIRSESNIVYALYRTQLFNPADIENVRRIQAGYLVQPLSAFAGTTPPAAAPTPDWPKPQAGMLDSLSVFTYLNFMLQFAPTDTSEIALMKRFATIDIGAGRAFDPAKLTPATHAAFEAGLAQAKTEFAEFKTREIDTHKVSSTQLFGTRALLQNNYMYRFAGARLGIYGNSAAEAVYVPGFVDAEGQPLDAAKNRYTLHFAKGELPPNEAFWSLTMYNGKNQFLVANSLDRYLINSSMVPQLTFDADGGLTLYIQATSPGKKLESNWLPAPSGPFYTVLRIYQPSESVQTGTWKAPPVVLVK